MSNLFSMVTLRSSLDYTHYSIDSFFKNTKLNEDDEFLSLTSIEDIIRPSVDKSFKRIKQIKKERLNTF